MISSVSSTNSLTSMLQMRQQMFSKIDTNGDGKHDEDELAQMAANGPQGGPGVEEILSRFDSDGDGAISEAEFNAADPGARGQMGGVQPMSTEELVAKMFSDIDENSDGALNIDELEQMAAMGPENGPTAGELLSQLDTDGDGSVSQSEFSQGPQANGPIEGPPPPPPSEAQDTSQTESIFSLFDSNGDGSISETEFDTIMSQITSALSAYQASGTSYSDSYMQSSLSSSLYA